MPLADAHRILDRVKELGGEIVPIEEGLIRYRGPALSGQLRQLIHENKAIILSALEPEAMDDVLSDDSNPTACRGCAAAIPAGTTLCVDCGSKRSPLIRYAVELGALAEERSLRGLALLALDKRRYPGLRLADGQTAGPGLTSWCPVLQEAGPEVLRQIIDLARRSKTRSGGEDK